jgi:hypothetical protein
LGSTPKTRQVKLPLRFNAEEVKEVDEGGDEYHDGHDLEHVETGGTTLSMEA